ncbi:hypothetical protein BH20ACI4_BH20ACI4_01620 [soil metagenome]
MKRSFFLIIEKSIFKKNTFSNFYFSEALSTRNVVASELSVVERN